MAGRSRCAALVVLTCCLCSGCEPVGPLLSPRDAGPAVEEGDADAPAFQMRQLSGPREALVWDIRDVRLSPDDPFVIFSGEGGELYRVDPAQTSPALRLTRTASDRKASFVALAGDELIWTSSSARVAGRPPDAYPAVYRTHVPTLEQSQLFECPSVNGLSLAWLSRREQLALSCTEQQKTTLRLLDVRGQQAAAVVLPQETRPSRPTPTLIPAQSAEALIVRYTDKMVVVQLAEEAALEPVTLPLPSGAISWAEFDPQHERLVVALGGRPVRIYSLRLDGTDLTELTAAEAFDVVADGPTLASLAGRSLVGGMLYLLARSNDNQQRLFRIRTDGEQADAFNGADAQDSTRLYVVNARGDLVYAVGRELRLLAAGQPPESERTITASAAPDQLWIDDNSQLFFFAAQGDAAAETPSALELFAVGQAAAPRRLAAVRASDATIRQVQYSATEDRVVFAADLLASSVTELFDVPLAGDTAPRRLSAELTQYGDVSWAQLTADGRHALYLADGERNGAIELYAADLQRQDPPRKLSSPLLEKGGSVTSWHFSADSTRVLYLSGERNHRENEVDLYSVPLTAGAPVALHEPLPDGQALWIDLKTTPGSPLVVFGAGVPWTSLVDGCVLYAADQDGTRRVPLLASERAALPYGVNAFDVCPDGATVIYAARSPDAIGPASWIYAMGRDGANRRVVVSFEGLGTGVQLLGPSSPGFRCTEDSKQVVYLANHEAGLRDELFVQPLDASSARRKLNPELGPDEAVERFRLVPQSTRVVFSLQAPSQRRVGSADLKRGSEPALFAPEAPAPQWLLVRAVFGPRGDWALLPTIEGDLYRLDLEGRQLRPLSERQEGEGLLLDDLVVTDDQTGCDALPRGCR
jgi:hypothetical protein